MTNAERQKQYYELINNELIKLFPTQRLAQSKLFEAMKYSIDAGGKRIRPILTLEFARINRGKTETALPFALAIELIHTYSLIHDDLPCMDNDEMRRGKPTNHIAFGEAAAVLAGDALLNMAFEVILNADYGISDAKIIQATRVLAKASGAFGMIGGQVLDIEGEQKELSSDSIRNIHKLKTGALITAACEMGCIVSDADDGLIESARRFGELLGLAFQLKDDILGAEGDSTILGKTAGLDNKNGKSTLVGLFGVENCKKHLSELTYAAVSELNAFKGNEFLLYLTDKLSSRSY